MRQVSVGSPLRIGVMSAAIVLLADVAVSLAIESNSIGRWLLVPLVGVAASTAATLLQSPPEPPSADDFLLDPADARRRQISAGRGTLPLIAAVAICLVAVGAGGLGVAVASQYAMGWVTGNEHGPNRLVAPVTSDKAGLSITINRIEQTPHFTRVSFTVSNTSQTAVSLPIDDGNCTLIAGDGTTRRAESFRSDWNETLAQGSEHSGVVVFGGHLPSTATRARIAFAHFFAESSTTPQTVQVANLVLQPPS